MNTNQITFGKALSSPIGKKIITGVTGIALMLFATGHLAGNLLLLAPTGDLFNLYAYKLTSLGPLLYVIEAILTLFFLSHAVTGIQIWLGKKKARPQDYKVYKTQGGKSKQTLSSRSMIFTGIVLLVFLVLHLLHFKFGEMYYTTIPGVEGQVRDLYKLVIGYYQSELNVAAYVAVMIMLGVHLRHGFWSALQSLAAVKPRWSNSLHTFGLFYGALLAVGFIALPIWIYIAH